MSGAWLRRLRWPTAALGLLALPTAALAATGPSVTQLNGAQLAGSFSMAGRVTAAAGVRGERRGERVMRTWTFFGPCPSTPCQTVTLTRARSGGTDTLILSRRSPSVYGGSGVFVLPLGCGGRFYEWGEIVPFTITVTVTEVSATARGPLAAALTATYVSRSRRNLTPCVVAPAHDAATYTGWLG